MDWIALLLSGLIFPTLWYFLRRSNQQAEALAKEVLLVKENDLAHIATDIKEIKDDVRVLTSKFMDHLEDHSR